MNIQSSVPGMAARGSIIHSRSDISKGARVFRAEMRNRRRRMKRESRIFLFGIKKICQTRIDSIEREINSQVRENFITFSLWDLCLGENLIYLKDCVLE